MATTDCEKISFTKSVYDLGYVHQDTDFSIYPMNFVGVLAVKTEVGLPPGQLTLISSCPDQIKFVDWQNNLVNPYFYEVPVPPPNPGNLLTGGNTYYITFNLALTECGAFECEISYSYVYDYINGDPQECTGTTTIKAYNATCDFETCFLQAAEVYCTLDMGCIDDICKDPCYQKLVKLFLIDKTIRYKITRWDWDTINKLYDQALNGICNCDCNGIPVGDVKNTEETTINN